MRPELAGHSMARTLAAVVGAPPAAIAVGLAMAAVLPLSIHARFILGMYAVLPLWCLLLCGALLARSGTRAWVGLGVVSLVASAVALLAR